MATRKLDKGELRSRRSGNKYLNFFYFKNEHLIVFRLKQAELLRVVGEFSLRIMALCHCPPLMATQIAG
jgi:hypothetical protein